jgi:uncharacterized membrane protein
MPIKTRTDNLISRKLARWERRLFNALFVAAYALVVARLWWPIALPGKPGWPEAVLLLLAVVGTLAALARHLPFPNGLGAAGLIAVAGGAADWLCGETGIPFGAFTPGESAGPTLFRVLPWAMPLIWVLAILNSRGVARLILQPWRKLRAYGFWLIGLTTVLAVLFEFAFEPFASRVNHYWRWEPTKFPVSWQGAPGSNFLGWVVMTLLILAFVTPILIKKQPVHRRPPDFHPLGVWLGGILLFGAGASMRGLWSAVLLDATIGAAVAIAAIRGARWYEK